MKKVSKIFGIIAGVLLVSLFSIVLWEKITSSLENVSSSENKDLPKELKFEISKEDLPIIEPRSDFENPKFQQIEPRFDGAEFQQNVNNLQDNFKWNLKIPQIEPKYENLKKTIEDLKKELEWDDFQRQLEWNKFRRQQKESLFEQEQLLQRLKDSQWDINDYPLNLKSPYDFLHELEQEKFQRRLQQSIDDLNWQLERLHRDFNNLEWQRNRSKFPLLDELNMENRETFRYIED